MHMNEAEATPIMNRRIGMTYLSAADPALTKRTWKEVMEDIIKDKTGPTRRRWDIAIRDPAFKLIEDQVVMTTLPDQLAEALGVGRYVRWGRFYSTRLHDLRKTSLLIAGQEVLTTDNVGLKASLLVTYQVVDPVKATHETQNWSADLHNAAQLALRAVVGGVAVESLLGQRLELGAQLLARVQPDAAKIGINVLAVEVKDVMFPADLKRPSPKC